MWVFIVMIIIFLINIGIAIWLDEPALIVVGILADIIPLIASIPTEVTEHGYNKAKNAAYVLEQIDSLTLDNIDLVQECLDVLDRYQENRNEVEEKKDNKWNGKIYKPENLEKYPEVHVDEEILNKFR